MYKVIFFTFVKNFNMSCKNCQKSLVPEDKFCSNCGAQIVTQRLTVKKVIHEFSQRYLSFDNKFLSTFKTMLVGGEWLFGWIKNALCQSNLLSDYCRNIK